jgi:hypothetical protein
MLNELLLAEATLQGIRLVTNLALAAGILLAAGALGLTLTNRASRTRAIRLTRGAARVAIGAGALIVATVIAVVVASRFQSLERYEWTLDLTQDAPLAPFLEGGCATWMIGQRAYRDCIYEGRIELAARFPGDRAVSRTGRALWASGHDGRLTSLHLFLDRMSLGEAQTTIDALVAPWQLQRESYDEWLADARAGRVERASYFTPPDADRIAPWLEVSARPLDPATGDDRPWAVSLKWHWSDD